MMRSIVFSCITLLVKFIIHCIARGMWLRIFSLGGFRYLMKLIVPGLFLYYYQYDDSSIECQLYWIPEVVLTIAPPKECRKVISHTTKCFLFTVCSNGAHKTATTTTASTPSIQQKNIVKENEDIVSSATMVPTQCPIKPRDNKLLEHIQPCQQLICDSLPQTRQLNLSNKARNSPRFRLTKCFPLFLGHSMQWIQFLPEGGGLIQVDIGGHSSIQLAPLVSF
jgi:hypothetical protein